MPAGTLATFCTNLPSTATYSAFMFRNERAGADMQRGSARFDQLENIAEVKLQPALVPAGEQGVRDRFEQVFHPLLRSLFDGTFSKCAGISFDPVEKVYVIHISVRPSW